MRFKVGDYVRIKSLDWYNKNKDNYGAIYAGNGFCFWKNMTRHCGEIMKITTVKVDPEDSNKGFYFMENSDEKWTDEMIEGLVEEETKFGTASKPIEIKSNANCLTQERVDEMSLDKAGQITDFEYEGLAYTLPDGYQFVDENGNVINATKIVLEKKKKEYPKTYEECCLILGIPVAPLNPLKITIKSSQYEKHLGSLIEDFIHLRTCRDAYWKIAGEGLGKPWKPDWLDDDTKKYVITSTKVFETFGGLGYINHILTFPTEEMRDAFYENFKELIEQCKELL